MAIDNSENEIGSYHIANNPSLYTPARSNTFEFVVTDLDNLKSAYEGTSIAKAQEILRFSVTQASVPHFTQDVISIKRGNSTVKFAGVPTFPDGSIIVNDYVGADTKSVLMAWQNLSYSVNTDSVGSVEDYKKDCYLIEYNETTQVRQWLLYGCWISGLSEGEFNSEDGGKRTITATIQYDKAVMILPEEE